MPVDSSRPEQRPPRPVIVCGTTFGQVYPQGSSRTLPCGWRAFWRDSERSRSCSQYHGVPLFTRVDDLPDVEVACVVVRSALLEAKAASWRVGW